MVSVIIPIYNTGEYLRNCIQSVQNQTYHDLQIIMVDDGSDNETSSICDEIAASDSRIKVIHKVNEGVSIARNVGLEAAVGDIICFVDSDDTIEGGMIERLVKALDDNGADIAMCDASTIFPDGTSEPDTIHALKKTCVLDKSDITPAMLKKQANFPVGIKFSEDRIFNIIAIGCANRIAYIKESYYNRLIRKGSACFRFYPDMTEQIVKMRNILLSTVEGYWGKKFLQPFELQISGQIRYSITNYTAPYSGLKFNQQLKEVKSLCKDAAIQKCIAKSNSGDIRSKLIRNNNYFLLTILGVLTNKYHKLCKIGQYQQ